MDKILPLPESVYTTPSAYFVDIAYLIKHGREEAAKLLFESALVFAVESNKKQSGLVAKLAVETID